jgi:serine/threonine protein kinase
MKNVHNGRSAPGRQQPSLGHCGLESGLLAGFLGCVGVELMDRLQAGDPSQVGSFRLLGRLGEGGMGRVFLGASPGGRKVAIKVVRAQYSNDAEFRRRFAREVAAARQVGGFHTALVVDADPAAGPPWMATSYIPGPSLADAVAEHGPLHEAGVRELGAALAEGLAAIHACGLIHRDLKPSNIILADDGARIIDFGIARGADATALTGSHAVIGTLRYMSPEQLHGLDLTPGGDVFALGAVLAYAATGHDPFEAPTIPAVINHILNDPPNLGPLTGDVGEIIRACLAKEPGDRPDPRDLLARFIPRRRPTIRPWRPRWSEFPRRSRLRGLSRCPQGNQNAPPRKSRCTTARPARALTSPGSRWSRLVGERKMPSCRPQGFGGENTGGGRS